MEEICAPWRREDSVAQLIERVWFEAGIRVMPMIPGGPLVPFLDILYQEGRIAPLLVGHEQNAAFMAEGYYRASGRMAAVGVTAGPGLTNTTTGVAVAFREQSPLFLLSAQVATANMGLDAAQELNTVDILRPISKASVQLCEPEFAELVIRDLIDLARTPPFGPVHLSVPTDLFGIAVPARSTHGLDERGGDSHVV